MADRDDGLVRLGMTRRDVLRRGAVTAGVFSVPSLLSACAGSDEEKADVKPRAGGTLRVAFVGGGTAETLDPHGGNTMIDTGRSTVLYEKLFDQYGRRGKVGPTLAESLESNKAGDEWTLRLKSDVVWHNGRPLTVDDVVYTFNRILDPKNKLGGASDIGFIDRNRLRKLDKLTLRMGFNTPIADPSTAFASRFLPIIQDGFTDFDKPIGTGAFKFESWTRGKRSQFVKFGDYRIDGRPYVDELVYLSIPDQTARFNALRSGQVDAMENLQAAQANSIGSDPNVKVLDSPTGGMVTMVTDLTKAPTSDRRVRQALRLLVDREQMVENVLSGYGEVGNDLFSPFDPLFDDSIEQRTYDPEQARSLLKAAGHSNLALELASATAAPGMLESAQAFAEQAREGGVKVSVKQSPADSYYTDRYMKVPFFQTQWGNYPLDSMIALSTESKAPYNEARYSNPEFDKLWRDARGTLDEGSRTEKYHELQRMLHDDGGYIIWGFANFLDGYRSNVHGFTPNPARPLGFFNFKDVWLS